MATLNPFDLLVDDSEDPAQLISAVSLEKVKKAAAPATGGAAPQGKPAGKLPSRPVPPAQAVREAKTETGRGRGRGSYGGGRGGGRGGYERDSGNDGRRYGGNDGARTGGNDGGRFGGSDGFSGGRRPSEEVDGGRPYERRGGGGPRGPPRGGRQGGDFSNGEVAEGERPRRTYDRHSGSGRGNEFKREGAGRGNWGTPSDDVAPEAEEVAVEVEKTEKQIAEEEAEAARRAEEEAARRAEEEAEEKKMTLEEYQKVLEEKRKALLSEVAEERIVEVDKELKKMQQLSSKKTNDEIFIKLGSEKDKRPSEKEAKAKKSVSIQEYLKPADGERYSGGGRGRGRGGRGGARGGGSGGGIYAPAPKIEDPSQFPSLGGK